MAGTLLDSSPPFLSISSSIDFSPNTPTNPFSNLHDRLVATPRNFGSALRTPLRGSPIRVGEGSNSTGKFSDKVRCPDRMNTPHNIPRSSSSGDRMETDSPTPAITYQNRFVDEFQRQYLPADDLPGFELLPYASSQTTTNPPIITRPSGYSMIDLARSLRMPSYLKTKPSGPVIVPQTKITVPVGKENTLFRNICDTLHKALDERVSDYDKDNCRAADAVLLAIPTSVCERLIFGKRMGKDQYWEREIELLLGHMTRVAKLKMPWGEPIIYGVYVGLIDDFWGLEDGAIVFYGRDKKMYAYPGSNWADKEGYWEIFGVEDGWEMRELSSDNEPRDDEAFAVH